MASRHHEYLILFGYYHIIITNGYYVKYLYLYIEREIEKGKRERERGERDGYYSQCPLDIIIE